MSKNRTLRLASGMFILVLLTTCVIGATFAKYVSVGSANDTARVAKWGVTVNTGGSLSLYGNAYAKAGGSDAATPTTWEDDSTGTAISVKTANAGEGNIVAPGTKSEAEGLTFSVSGTPEVAVEVSAVIDAEDVYLKKGTYGVMTDANVRDAAAFNNVMRAKSGKVYKLEGGTYRPVAAGAGYTGGQYYVLSDKTTLSNDYYPVTYKLYEDDSDTVVSGVSTAVQAAQELTGSIPEPNPGYKGSFSKSEPCPVNTVLDSISLPIGDVKLGWEWPFNGNDPQKSAADTILNDMMAAARGVDSNAVVVFADGTDNATATALTIAGGGGYTVKNGSDVVANLRTLFDVSLKVTQID